MANLDINITTTADTSGAAQSKAAVQGLTNEVKTGSTESENYHEKQKQIIEAMHMVSLMTGGEVREGMHETTLGMKLLGSLTGEMTMGTVGLAMAVGTAIPLIVGYFKEGAEKSAEEAKKMQEEIDKNIVEIGETVSEAHLERLNEMATDLQDAKTAAEQLTQEFPKTMKAEAEFATAALVNEGLMATTQHNIAIAMGQRVNAVKELEAAEELASKKRELAMLQSIEAQKKELEDTKKKKVQAEGDLKLIEDDLSRKKAELEKSRSDLVESRARKNVLTTEVKSVPLSMDALLDPADYDEYINGDPKHGAADQWKVEGKYLESRISTSEKDVKKLSNDIKALERKEKRAETAVGVAQNKVEDETSSVEINIAKLKDDFIAQDLSGKSKELVDIGKQNAADSNDLISKVTATTALEASAYADARQIGSDLMIQSKEIPRLIADWQRILGSYQIGFVQMAGNTQENVKRITEIINNLNAQANQSKSINSNLEDTFSITNQTAAKVAALEYQIRILHDKVSH